MKKEIEDKYNYARRECKLNTKIRFNGEDTIYIVCGNPYVEHKCLRVLIKTDDSRAYSAKTLVYDNGLINYTFV